MRIQATRSGILLSNQKAALKNQKTARSIFLRHRPEQLHTAIITPSEGDVVVLSYFFKQLSPIIFRFVLQTKEQGGSGFLRGRRIDDLLYPNAHALIGVWG